MLAARFRGVGRIELEEVPEPSCPPGGLLIRCQACAICGTDVRTYRFGSDHVPVGRIMGHEVVGEIVEVGPVCPRPFEAGQRVAVEPAIGCGECPSCVNGAPNICQSLTTIGFEYDGGFAQYMAVPEKAVAMGNVAVIPPGTKADAASIALSEPIGCCCNGQELVNVGFGDTVLIIGAGPIGCVHLLLARLKGAERVFLADQVRARLDEAARRFHPDAVIDTSQVSLRDEVMRLTGGLGASVVIVACSSWDAQCEALRVAALRGRVSLFGGLPGPPKAGTAAAVFDTNLIHYKQLSVAGSHAASPRHHRMALRLITTGRLDTKPLISSIMSLAAIGEALEIAGRGDSMKIVLKPN